MTATNDGAACAIVAGVGSRRWAKLQKDGRTSYLPSGHRAPVADPIAQPSRWLEITLSVDEFVAAFLGEATTIARYAPDAGPLVGAAYPEQHAGLSTKFDDTVVLAQDGVLKEKILLEYKTAKPSRGRQWDGNAHERLSFQVMQYLEVATRYTRCSMLVMANGAFARYRNKYHVNFHVQADRLSNFAWFTLNHVCTMRDYADFVAGLLGWLINGTDRRVGRLAS